MLQRISSFVVLSLFVVSIGFCQARNENVKVIFNNQLTFNDLVKIKLDLADKGIQIDYPILKFDEENNLSDMSFKIVCHDGFKGAASKSRLGKHSNFGFIRKYEGDTPLIVGDLE